MNKSDENIFVFLTRRRKELEESPEELVSRIFRGLSSAEFSGVIRGLARITAQDTHCVHLRDQLSLARLHKEDLGAHIRAKIKQLGDMQGLCSEVPENKKATLLEMAVAEESAKFLQELSNELAEFI